MWSYWRRVLRRAFADTIEYLGHKPRKSIYAALAMVLAIGLYGSIFGASEIEPKLSWWLVGLASVGAVFLVVLVAHIFMAPHKMESDLIASHGSERSKLQSANQELIAQNISLEKKAPSDPAKAMVKSQFQEFLQRYDSLLHQVSWPDPSIHPSDTATEFMRLEKEAANFFDKHFPSFNLRLAGKVGFNLSGDNYERIRTVAPHRMAALNEAIEMWN